MKRSVQQARKRTQSSGLPSFYEGSNQGGDTVEKPKKPVSVWTPTTTNRGDSESNR